MTDKEQESRVSSPSDNPKHEYLEVTGTANTVANLMRRPLPQVSEMTGTFEKLRNLRELIAEQKEKERNLPDSTIEDDEDTGNTVTITVNNTLLGQYMTLAESDESDSGDEGDVVNDIVPPKDSSSDSDGASSEDEETEMVLSLGQKDRESLVQILSESDNEDGEVDSTNQAKRQKLE